jgi:hypothetical protein
MLQHPDTAMLWASRCPLACRLAEYCLLKTARQKTASRNLPAGRLHLIYTAAVWPRPYCRLTGPVQPITARRLLASAAAQPIRTLPLCTRKYLERYTVNHKKLCYSLNTDAINAQIDLYSDVHYMRSVPVHDHPVYAQ